MADLTSIEKRRLEQLFGMGTGYVLDFSNRTFAEFVQESIGRDIYDTRYDFGSGSKANRLRAFWTIEGNHLVARLIESLIEYGCETSSAAKGSLLHDNCLRIVARLKQSRPVADADALSATVDERDFETIAKQVRDAIDKNEPETGLDRLHTFVIKFGRALCDKHGIPVARGKALHSLFGEYVKWLRDHGHLDSEMAAHILKSNISVLEAFNEVRNNQSLAHDNPILSYDESLLIFNHVASLVRFIRGLEARIDKANRDGPRKVALVPPTDVFESRNFGRLDPRLELLRAYIREKKVTLAGFMELGAELKLDGYFLGVIPNHQIYVRYLNDNKGAIGALASEFYNRPIEVQLAEPKQRKEA